MNDFHANKYGIAMDTDEPMRMDAVDLRGKGMGGMSDLLILADHFESDKPFGDHRGVTSENRWDGTHHNYNDNFHPLDRPNLNAMMLDGHAETINRTWNNGWWRWAHTNYSLSTFNDGE